MRFRSVLSAFVMAIGVGSTVTFGQVFSATPSPGATDPYGTLDGTWTMYRQASSASVPAYLEATNTANPTLATLDNMITGYQAVGPGILIDTAATGPAIASNLLYLSDITNGIGTAYDGFDFRIGFMENPLSFVASKGYDNGFNATGNLDPYYGTWNSDAVYLHVSVNKRTDGTWEVSGVKNAQTVGSGVTDVEEVRKDNGLDFAGDVTRVMAGSGATPANEVAGEVGSPIELNWWIDGSNIMNVKLGTQVYQWDLTSHLSDATFDGGFNVAAAKPFTFMGWNSWNGATTTSASGDVGVLMPGDANADGVVDAADQAILDANLGLSEVGWAHGDFNQDGMVDAADQAILDANSAPTVLLGDANNDGVVSADDFAAVQTNFGSTGAADGLLPGDANDDGVVSADDFAAIQTNFGSVLGSAVDAAPVPEPATLALLALGGLAVIRRRK